METTQKYALVHQSGSIRVHVPAAVLYDLDKSQAVMRNVLARLGCASCCSGLQIAFQAIEQEFVADERGQLSPRE